MPRINTRIEGARGCGFRKPGGFYIVADGTGSNCGCLPFDIPDDVPTYSLFPQWLELGRVAGYKRNRKRCDGKAKCWLASAPDDTVVMLDFVGMSHYRRASRFMREAARMGISRRLNRKLLDRIEIGKTVVLLAHKEASNVMTDEGVKAIRQVFAAFKPQRIEYIVKPDDTDEYLERLEAKGITLVQVQKAGKVLDLGLSSN